nr:unnamed protein product [Spirometra erinaceieuropaei]
MNPTASSPPKYNAKHAYHICVHSATTTQNRFQRVFGDQVQRSDCTNRRLSDRLFLASLTPTNSCYSSEPPLPSSSSYSSSSSSPSSATSSSSSNAPTAAALVAVTHASITHIHGAADTTPPTSDSRIEDKDHTCPPCEPSPHASAWSVTCESIAQRLANQRLENQPTPAALASTASTALAPSRIAWAYSATCASTTICSRKPPAAPRHHTLIHCPHHHHHHTLLLTHRKHPTATYHATCQQSDTPGSVFGGRVSQQDQSPDFPGVPHLLVEMVKALRVRGLNMEGVYRVPGRASRIQAIIQLANSNVSELCDRLVCDEEAFDGRTISSAIKRYLGTLPVSLLNAHMFASFVASRTNETGTKRCGRSLRTPAGLARALWQVRTGLVKAFGCPGNATAEDQERGWRMATLDYMMRHLREVVALQAINRMSPRALALCLAPSLFGSTDDAETNSQVCISQQLPSSMPFYAITSSFSGHYLMLLLFHVCHHHHQQVLELLIEHWPWLSLSLHRDSQPVSAEGLTEPVADACLYACRYQRHCFLRSLCLPPTLPLSPPPSPPPPHSVDGVFASACT